GAEVGELGAGRQLAEDQEVRRLDERRLHRELLDRIAAVAQDAPVAVDIGDRAAACAGIRIAAVERDQPRVGAQRRDVDGSLLLGADDDGQVTLVAVLYEGCGVAHLGPPCDSGILRGTPADGAMPTIRGGSRAPAGRGGLDVTPHSPSSRPFLTGPWRGL